MNPSGGPTRPAGHPLMKGTCVFLATTTVSVGVDVRSSKHRTQARTLFGSPLIDQPSALVLRSGEW